MSIIKTDLSKTNNVTIVEFGKGTLLVTNGTNKIGGYKSILIKKKEYSQIGEVNPLTKNSDEFNPEISIVFRNKESFDVFKEYVNNIELEFNQEKALEEKEAKH